MVSCGQTALVNGHGFRLYIENTDLALDWVYVGGETSSKMSVSTKTADASNKDSAGGMNIPTGYDWSMDCSAAWSPTDPGQILVRNAAINLTTKRVAWRYSGATTGWYGYATFSWNASAPDRDIATFDFTVAGCGNIVDGA